ncbi:sulfotransferase 2A8-like [Amblyomma americanum]
MPGRRPYRQVIDSVPRSVFLNQDILRKSLTFRAAKGDIVQCTYPKSGSHWLQYLTQLIITKGKPIKNYSEYNRNHRAVEYTECCDWKSDLPARLLFTHLPFKKEALNQDAKYIYMARNPWDVCVSLYRVMSDLSVYQFQSGTFEEFFEPFAEDDLGFGDYFEHVMSGYALRDEPNVFFLTYEELKQDTRRTVLRLAHFLGEEYGLALGEDGQMLANVLEWSKPENMKKVIVLDLKEDDASEWKGLFTRKKMTSKHGYEGDKTKFSVVKEARVGSWKKYFTPELLTRFEAKIQAKGEKAFFMELWADIHDEAIAMSRMPA